MRGWPPPVRHPSSGETVLAYVPTHTLELVPSTFVVFFHLIIMSVAAQVTQALEVVYDPRRTAEERRAAQDVCA